MNGLRNGRNKLSELAFCATRKRAASLILAMLCKEPVRNSFIELVQTMADLNSTPRIPSMVAMKASSLARQECTTPSWPFNSSSRLCRDIVVNMPAFPRSRMQEFTNSELILSLTSHNNSSQYIYANRRGNVFKNQCNPFSVID